MRWLSGWQSSAVSLSLGLRYAGFTNGHGRILHVSLSRSEAPREAYIEEIKKYAADDLVFLDEAIFDEKTGWRHRGYGPQGERIQYAANTTRGDTYAVLAATHSMAGCPVQC